MKVKSFLKYCPAVTGAAYSPKFILDAKVQNSVFRKISYSGTLNLNELFQILKSSENVKSRGLDRVRNENLFPQTTLDKRLETTHEVTRTFTFW